MTHEIESASVCVGRAGGAPRFTGEKSVETRGTANDFRDPDACTETPRTDGEFRSPFTVRVRWPYPGLPGRVRFAIRSARLTQRDRAVHEEPKAREEVGNAYKCWERSLENGVGSLQEVNSGQVSM